MIKSENIYITVPTYNSKKDNWSETVFKTKEEFRTFIESKVKKVGEYDLKNTDFWIKARLTFEKNGLYCRHVVNTHDYNEFWEVTEWNKIVNGIIVDNFYVSGNYYLYLNYLPIKDMVKNETTFPEVWDSDYHFFLYIELCQLKGKHACIVKKRRWGLTYKVVACIIRQVWFYKDTVNKIIAFDESYVKSAWDFLDKYRDFLNGSTAYYRNFDPDKPLNWHQRKATIQGGKKIYRGKKSKIKGVTTKTSPSKPVSGFSTIAFFEESGINPTLDKSVEYLKPSLKIGGATTGLIIVAGSVGELKECEPLKRYALNPARYDFLGVEDIFDNTGKEICFFVPEYWNYVSSDIDENGNEVNIERCYDKDGNSNIEYAYKKYLETDEREKKKKTPEEYRLWKSQRPSTLTECFQERSENIFPTQIIGARHRHLEKEYKPQTVQLFYNSDYTIGFEFKALPLIEEFPLKRSSDRSGAIVIHEYPQFKTQFGIYYAGVDTITSKKGTMSDSLFSIYVFKGYYYENEMIQGGYPVAWYTGRMDNYKDTYETALKLIKYYNVQAAIESNQETFIEWLIHKKEQKHVLKRSQIPLLKEITPGSRIGEEYGVRMTDKVRESLHTMSINYMNEEISTIFTETTTNVLYGVEKIFDKMLLKEYLEYTNTGNFDRIDAFGLGLLAVKSNEVRGNIIKVNKEPIKVETRSFNPLQTVYNNTGGYQRINQFIKRY